MTDLVFVPSGEGLDTEADVSLFQFTAEHLNVKISLTKLLDSF